MVALIDTWQYRVRILVTGCIVAGVGALFLYFGYPWVAWGLFIPLGAFMAWYLFFPRGGLGDMARVHTLAQIGEKHYVATMIDRIGAFVPSFAGTPFPCLIWDHEGRATNAERSAVARALLEAGCRYAVCGGKHCEDWHDAVDAEFETLHLEDPDEVEGEALVMTTWHEGESPDEVAFFFVYNTDFNELAFARYLVLHIGRGPAMERVNAAVREHARSLATEA